jgi:hypothetical protein
VAHKEIRIPYSRIKNNQTSSTEMEQIFKEHGLDAHRHEVNELYDDHDKQERFIKVQTPKLIVGFGKAST